MLLELSPPPSPPVLPGGDGESSWAASGFSRTRKSAPSLRSERGGLSLAASGFQAALLQRCEGLRQQLVLWRKNSGQKRGLEMETREVRRVGAKSSEKAGLVLRWRGHQGRCRNLVSTILSVFNFAAKPCFNEDLGRCPVCKTVKSTIALVEARVGWAAT